jgi:3-(3-hydroxy-phenyl)propionate hydroxylase
VRATVGLDSHGESYVEDWLIVDAIGVPGSFDHVEFICDPERPTPHMIAPGGRTRWEFMLRAGETQAVMESDDTVRSLIAPWVTDADVRIERKAVYRFAARSCERFNVGRVFLAGDAAHVTPPFAGQGLVAGLRDAANLAWKLAWVVRGRAAASILESYDQERRPHARKMIALAKFMGSFIMPRSRAKAFVVHGAMKLLRSAPFLRSRTEGLAMKPTMSYPRGLFVRGRGAMKRGVWFPQSLLRRSSGEVVLSDDALGGGLALVGLGADPAQALDTETATRWANAGGAVVEISAQAHAAALEDGEGRLAGRKPKWCVVVRPDHTILHDGPVADASRLVRESLQLIGAP